MNGTRFSSNNRRLDLEERSTPWHLKRHAGNYTQSLGGPIQSGTFEAMEFPPSHAAKQTFTAFAGNIASGGDGAIKWNHRNLNSKPFYMLLSMATVYFCVQYLTSN